jgi:hypothetical protein
VEIEEVEIEKPEGMNFILGQTHFIKSVEDLYEAMINAVPQAKFGMAFCESSGPCLVRVEGNDERLKEIAKKNASKIAAGHSFIIFMDGCYPLNVLRSIKMVPEVCNIYCATANPVKVLLVEDELGKGKGRGIIGVIDGFKSKGIEREKDVEERKKFLREIGYKR